MRITIERALTQRICAKEIHEKLVFKGKLRVAERIVEGLKNEADKCGQEVLMLQSRC